MKKFIILTMLLVPVISLAGGYEGTPTVASVQIVRQEGLWYEINSETPFSGVVTRTFPSGQKESEYNYLNGKFHGYVRRWYENGPIRRDAIYVNGLSNGLEIVWHLNGQIAGMIQYVEERANGY